MTAILVRIATDGKGIDSLNRLYGVGLIHRLDGFVWASWAAIRAEELKA